MERQCGENKRAAPVGAALLFSYLNELCFLECLVGAVLGDSAETLGRDFDSHGLA